MADVSKKSYYRDADHKDLIVRVWFEDGKRRGQWWGKKAKKWFDSDGLAFTVADDIYDNHPLTYAEVEEITGQKAD